MTQQTIYTNQRSPPIKINPQNQRENNLNKEYAQRDISLLDRQICLSIKVIKTSVKTLITSPLNIPDTDPVHYHIFNLQGGSPFSTRECVEQGATPQGAEEKESLQQSLKDIHFCFPQMKQLLLAEK